MRRPAEFQCPVCGRACPRAEGSRHHVLPKSRGGRVTKTICVDCHKQIHALFSVKELARMGTLDALKATPEMQTWMAWVGRKPCHGLRRPAGIITP